MTGHAAPSICEARSRLGVNTLRLPLISFVVVDPVLAILSLFLFDAHLAFFAFFSTVGHGSSSISV
jgi:hypothetical protein